MSKMRPSDGHREHDERPLQALHEEGEMNPELEQRLVLLLRRCLTQMKLINGTEDSCVHRNPHDCRNHVLIKDVEQELEAHRGPL